MSKINGKYMVNLEGEERWQGWKFDSAEEAIEAANAVLKDRDLDSDIFGDRLDNLILREEGIAIFPEHFMLGIVKTPGVPNDLGNDILEWLDEGYWSDYAFDDDWISDYAFSEREIDQLNILIKRFIKDKVNESGYYIVDNIVEMLVV